MTTEIQAGKLSEFSIVYDYHIIISNNPSRQDLIRGYNFIL